MASPQRIYFFSPEESEGDTSMRNTLGGKGANLAEMCKIGIPVPPGFTITTDQSVEFHKYGDFPPGLEDEIVATVKRVEKSMGLELGNPAKPLLLSVRSGSRESMPGMMDTVLNVGLNSETVVGLAKMSGNEAFAYDSYRRLIQMFSSLLLGVDEAEFEHALVRRPAQIRLLSAAATLSSRRGAYGRGCPSERELCHATQRAPACHDGCSAHFGSDSAGACGGLQEAKREEAGAVADSDLTADDLKALVKTYQAIVIKVSGKPFPEDPIEQARCPRRDTVPAPVGGAAARAG